MVKYGDIAKNAVSVFEDNWNTKVKIQDKARVPDEKLTVLGRWEGHLGAKFCYKWAIVNGIKGDATVDASEKDGLVPSLALTKDAWTTTFKQDAKEKSCEVAVKQDFGSLNVGATVKLSDKKHSGNAHWAFVHKANGTTFEVGTKAKFEAPQDVKPEVAIGVLTCPGDLGVKYDHPKKQVTGHALVNGPSLFGFNWALGALYSAKTTGEAVNTAVVVQAKQGKDLTIKAKVDKLQTTPEPAISVILASKPVAESKETITIAGTWSHTSKGHIFGFSASRAQETGRTSNNQLLSLPRHTMMYEGFEYY